MLGVQSTLIFTSPVKKKRLRRSKRTPAVYLLCVIAFFAMRTAKLDVQGDVFAIVNKHIISAIFCTGVAIFCTTRRVCVAVQKLQCFGLFAAASRSSVFFALELPNDVVQNSGTCFRGHDIRTKQTSAHEGTAALQQRYTDARGHTPHDTNINGS